MPKIKPTEPPVVDQRRETEIALTTRRKRIDVATLLLSGKYLHQDNEAAAFQRMSPSEFSKWMKRRDQGTKLTYRQIFDDARCHGRATILRRAIDLSNQDKNPSAAVTMTKFVLQNEFGWSEKRVDEQSGTVTHNHNVRTIPRDEELAKMSDADLAGLAADIGGGKATRH